MNAVDGSASIVNTAEATQKLKEILNVGQVKAFGVGVNDKAIECVNGNPEKYTNGAKMLESLTKTAGMTKQYLTLKGGSNGCHSFDIYGKDVTIRASPLTYQSSSGSSRVQIRNIVDYGWEHKYYYGRLVAVHVSGNYIAYTMIGRDKTTGLVRVTNIKTGERALLKGMSGLVKDLSFAHVADQVILACVDEKGNLFVYKIEDDDTKLKPVAVLLVTQPSDVKSSDNHRVIWCQFIPEQNVEEVESPSLDEFKLLVVTHDDKAEMLNVDLVTKKHGSGPIAASDLYSGYQIITDHSQPIVDAAFSPDGAALATASLDGKVKFFQVYLHEESGSPRCLHKWTPHDGEPLSCLFFLDNHKNPNPDVQFWKYAITGANHNKEIKVWSCETWSCLQTIKFEIPEDETTEVCMKAGLDLSATYLTLSDINRKVFYVLILNQDNEQNIVTVCSIAEFPLTFPILSYAVVDASRKKYKQSVDNEHIEFATGDHDDDVQDDEIESYVEGVVVRLVYIQPKSLQECRIAYQPKSSVTFPTASVSSSLSQDSLGFRDRLSDMSFDTSIVTEINSSMADDSELQRTPLVSLSSTSSVSSQILMTPDAFTSSQSHVQNSKPVMHSSSLSIGTPSSIPLPPVTPSEEAALATPTEDVPLDAPLATSETNEQEPRHSGRSSGSSPSLEVQQILLTSRKRKFEDNKSSDDELVDQKNNIVNDYSNSKQNTIDSSRVCTLPPVALDSGIEEKIVSLSPFTRQSPTAGEYDPTIWPQAPNLTSEMNVSTVQQKEIYSDSTRKIFNASAGGEPRSDSPQAMPMIQFGDKLEQKLQNIQESLQAIRNTVQAQQVQMCEMQKELRLQQGATNALQQNFGRNFEKYEISVSNLLERIVLQIKQADHEKLEETLQNFGKREQQTRERLLSALTQTVTNTVSNKMDVLVKSEIRTNVLPSISKLIEPFKEQILIEIAQKLSSTDALIKDNISKIVKSKSVIDAIGSSIAVVLQGLLPPIYKDCFQNIIVPSFEKACQSMFLQLNDSFQRGTKEYVQLVEHHLERERKRRQNEQTRDPLLTQLQTFTETFQSKCDELSTNLMSNVQGELEGQLKICLSNFHDSLVKHIQQNVREEMHNAMKEQKTVIGDSVLQAIRSRAVTPVPSFDPQMQQAQILQLIKQTQYNAAFQQALSASDLSLVTFVCQSISPENVFGQNGCPLQQPVLLSLIQQLSSDLTTSTELKLKYLQDAVINLDRKNPITREHCVTIMDSLISNLKQFIKSNPSSEHNRTIKMLLLACRSVRD